MIRVFDLQSLEPDTYQLLFCDDSMIDYLWRMNSDKFYPIRNSEVSS